MELRSATFLVAFLTLTSSTFVFAQDPLDEMYGQAVHSYFRGDSVRAEELLNEVIVAGSQDPRAYFFRGLCQSRGSYEVGVADFERGAQLEIEGKKAINVGKSLERIQGPARMEIEKARSKARLASRARLLELQRSRYEEMQKGGVGNGLVVPPRAGEAAPMPNTNSIAPNDPFNSGMTKGDPKTMSEDPKKPAAGNEFEDAGDAMPDSTPPASADEDDPFK